MRDEASSKEMNRRSSNISQWSIDHPYSIIAFYLGILILAIVALGFFMPRRMMPYVESPIIGVVSMMPGLSAQEMETYISKPIEEQLVNVKNLRYIRSTSQDGFSIVSLEFYYKTDIKKALFDVQALMNVIQANLPQSGANLKPSWVLAIDPLNLPILSLSLTSENLDFLKLREFADNEVVNRLKVIKDVYSVVPFGGYKRQLQIKVDRHKLAAYNLSILDLKKVLDGYNVSRSGGTLTFGDYESIIRVDTLAKDAKSVLNYPIAKIVQGKTIPVFSAGASSGMGMESEESAEIKLPQENNFLTHPKIVYFKDLAKVIDTHWERRSAYHFVNKSKIIPSIEVSVIQNPGASSTLVVPKIKQELKRIEKDYPGVKFDISYDNAHFVGILFKNMFEELGLAILLTGIAVLFFLGDWRGALISLTTIPTSMALALLGLIPLGMTLNSGTLIGLLISIGRLVDDSIIDIHAVERYLRLGKSPKEAAVLGITEVRLAVISSTFMLCLALSPLLFCGGIVELMFKELVWPIILALLSSMLVSFTLTSLLAAQLLRPPSEREKEKNLWFYKIFLNPFQAFLDRLEHGYGKVIAWMLRNRFANLTRILATVILGFAFYYFIGSEMMPLADVGQAYGILETIPGTSFFQTEKIVYQIEKVILKHPEVEKVSTEIGQETMFESFSPFYTGYAMNLVNTAGFMFTFSDKDERKKNIWDVIDEVQKEALNTIPGIRRFQIKEMGSDVMASSSAPIQILVYGKDLNLLDRIGNEVLRIAENTKGLYQPAISWELQNPTYEVKIDLPRALELGLSPDEIAAQIYYSTRGGLTNEFYRLPNIRQDTILIRYEGEQRKNKIDLENMYLTGKDGVSIPLKSIAQIEYKNSPTIIERDGLRRIKSITGFYRLGKPPSMDLSMEVMMKAMQEINFPPGYGIEARGDMTQMMDSFRRLLAGLLFAFLFMFLILVAQFRGFLQPLQMVFSLPLELSGVFFMLFILHQNFSTVSIMAVIILSGMDITTAILLIDMIMRYRDKGVPRDQAVREACPQRLRPILMTSIITIIVMLPVSFFPKTGMDAYSPLGTVIIGGLIIGTILSLFDIPIMHTYIDDLVVLLNRKILKRERTWPARKEEEEFEK
ncbi:MAG: efflux RND transporter permease subunit [Armatimonadetes bacterium]|nr:efflux RND transporter permease subunit [Armatimonadota bacterium]